MKICSNGGLEGRLASDDGADMVAAVGEPDGMLPAIGGGRPPDRQCLGGSTMCGSARRSRKQWQIQ